MFKSIIARSIAGGATAGIAAGVVVVLTSGVPEAMADTPVLDAHHQSNAKSDRLPALLKGAACSSRGWPHYEPLCQFDLRRPANEARTVRVIALR